ncbi:hypothetical protein T05_10566 [Trichinella murrelli]|uniref:Uncharacterized protein n=1 Tax=Trichinella murrelli TaxID=144512 RepID=A0A0V0SP81_9BILA|nr:hypothetical protein T05_10566 [Trichinella murrelli]
MCFERLWNSGFLEKVTAPMLSTKTASLAATYSASVVDNATLLCF